MKESNDGEWRARSDGTYVQADLAYSLCRTNPRSSTGRVKIESTLEVGLILVTLSVV